MTAPRLMPLHEAERIGGWPDPDMSVVTGHRVPAPPLPLDVFDGWRQFIVDAAEARSVPVDYVAAGLLASAAAALGNSRRARAWDGWDEPTILWLGLVGGPSSGKSPALDVSIELLSKIEIEMAS